MLLRFSGMFGILMHEKPSCEISSSNVIFAQHIAFLIVASILQFRTSILWNTATASASIAVIASGLVAVWFLLWLTTAITSVFVALATRNLANIIDSHTTGEQCNGQEETDQKHRNGHKYPGQWFESDMAQSLEDTGAEDCDGDPVENTEEIGGQKMVENTGHTD